MKIAIDAYGGDNFPKVPVAAAVKAVNSFDFEIILLGDERVIHKTLEEYKYPENKIKVVHAPLVITNNEKPAYAVKPKTLSSIVQGAKLVRSGLADAFVSAGSTGALLGASLLNIGRINGVRRPALAAVLPKASGRVLLLDAGANSDCKSDDLYTFALMGSVYMQKIFGVKNPKIALLSNGTEEEKGSIITKEAFAKIKASTLNFIGNIEGTDITMGDADVVVSDGFVGNISLKSIEGCAKMIGECLKSALSKNLGSLIFKRVLQKSMEKFDQKKHGGAVLLGVNAPVIKVHGASTEAEFFNGILEAAKWAENDLVSKIESAVSVIK